MNFEILTNLYQKLMHQAYSLSTNKIVTKFHHLVGHKEVSKIQGSILEA